MKNEEWFLAQLENTALSVDDMINWLKTEAGEDADSLAELLQEILQERSLVDEGMHLLEMRASWNKDDLPFRKKWVQSAINILGYSPENKSMISSSGFDEQKVSVKACFSRLAVLRALADGILVYDKTWGFGVVAHVDHFYQRVEIDFTKKKSHQMSFAYAAETLQILDGEHLLAINHNDPERMKELLEKNQDEVVRILIRSFGPQPIHQVQALLIELLFPEAAWKGFWDKARKALKNDPLFEIPRKRNEPLRILKTERGYNDAWFAALLKERDMKQITRQVDELITAKDRPVLTEAFADVLANRLMFVVRGAGTSQPGLAVQALMQARETGVSSETLDPDAKLRDLFNDTLFLKTVGAVPAKEIRRLLNHLCEVDRSVTEEMLLRLIPQMDMSVLNDSLPLLIEHGRSDDVAVIISDLTKERQVADVEVLYWLYRHTEYLEKWSLGTLPDLARWLLRILSEEMNGEKLKTQNQIRAVFESREWIKMVIDAMETAESRGFMRRVKDSAAWDSITQRSILANLIKARPELQKIISESKEQETAPTSLRVTSRRTYYERQDQLEKIVLIEIPQVAKEIGIARSYGDLRENFEYKSAKEKQSLLQRRRAEFEAMLSQVSPTDFENVPTGSVAQGTGVTIRYADGKTERFYILGEWDRDEELGIISSQSRMALALMGLSAGDTVDLPSGDSEEITGEVLNVEPLTDAVKTWINQVKE